MRNFRSESVRGCTECGDDCRGGVCSLCERIEDLKNRKRLMWLAKSGYRIVVSPDLFHVVDGNRTVASGDTFKEAIDEGMRNEYTKENDL